MRKIGLVGGTGPESTVMYYKELNTQVDQLTGNKAMPEIAIESVNFWKAWELVESGNFGGLADYISEKVECLKAAGAEVISLTAVTMHSMLDDITEKTGVTLVSIPKAVSIEAAARGYKKVGLLGTAVTMEQDYMKKDFIQAGIEVVTPNEQDREIVATRIFEELERGIIKESTLDEMNEIIGKMQLEQGIEAVVLGCTELPLLLNDDNCVVPCLDSVQIHIKQLIQSACS